MIIIQHVVYDFVHLKKIKVLLVVVVVLLVLPMEIVVHQLVVQQHNINMQEQHAVFLKNIQIVNVKAQIVAIHLPFESLNIFVSTKSLSLRHPLYIHY